MKKAVKRQRTILGVVMREVQRKSDTQTLAIAAGSAHAGVPASQKVISDLLTLFERAERIRTQAAP